MLPPVRQPLAKQSLRREGGSSLIEVMVTVLILSTSLLGMAALQHRSLQYNHGAYLRSQANILAYDVLDRIRVNRANIDDYALAFEAEAPGGDSLAQTDLREWRANVVAKLPDGDSSIACTPTQRMCTVSIQWADNEGTDSFEYTTRI